MSIALSQWQERSEQVGITIFASLVPLSRCKCASPGTACTGTYFAFLLLFHFIAFHLDSLSERPLRPRSLHCTIPGNACNGILLWRNPCSNWACPWKEAKFAPSCVEQTCATITRVVSCIFGWVGVNNNTVEVLQ